MSGHTNRDLYKRVEALGDRSSTRTLEDFLKTMWALARPHAAAEAIPFETFIGILEASLTHEPPTVVPTSTLSGDSLSLEGYALWEHLILVQIADLREMASTGALADPHRYFGVDSPRGARWYNFDPGTYTECGIAGAFDGYTPGDPGRIPVPGLVAAFDASGELVAVDPSEIEHSVFEIESLTWDELARFLSCGQYYE
jgi:hypothetical protein